ncbi:MAG TPA: hypothetical protein VLD60_01875 [Nitrospira sp.]|nr:hypothetical protein [Nitrospira sp.]
MSLLGLVPPRAVAAIEPRGVEEFISAEQFVVRLRLRIQEMERTLSDNEQLEVAAFLPSGKAITVDTVGYENPALVILNGREQDTGKPSTLLAHQSSVQLLVSVESIQPGESRRILLFTHEK